MKGHQIAGGGIDPMPSISNDPATLCFVRLLLFLRNVTN
jgi:hypothetical protein